MTQRTLFALAAASLLALCAAIGPAAAQDWPTRPVTMVVPFPPGGGTDVLGRIIGRRLSEILGQQVIIENVGGAGGMIGSNKVAKATPDGYQFVLGSRADAINQTLYKHPLYDLKADLVPVILVADQPMAMIARRDLPVDGLQDFIAYVKKNQATMRTGSAGIGSTGYVDCALFNQAIGVKVQDIPYRGGGPALQDLIGGQYDYFMTLSPTAVPPIQSNLVKGIAVFRRERLPSLPSLPTAYEQGMKDFDASTWFAFFFPKGTPDAIIKKLHDATAA
ncbi:MAG TPA: tripartite tricarboxylate transporter substrate binding protein, partial [Xanthobacteraceae bacterium]|nr:tripartite tricarboxylate transporter substrate binding protein [Xanthobacteraceae bacterium]